MTDRVALTLLGRVFEKVYAATESFEPDCVGAHMAYLSWEIVRGQNADASTVDWTTADAQPILQIFLELFAPDDPVWDYIVLP